MIGRIRGKLLEKGVAEVLVEAGGIGYSLQVASATAARLPEPGVEVTLWVTTRIRDEMIQLYGFADKREQAMFLRLLKVSGVGPKLAFAIISGGDIARLEQQLINQEIDALCKLPGVGKKLSRRLVLELGEGLRKELQADALARAPLPGAALAAEAVAALEALGYQSREVAGLVARLAAEDPGGGIEKLLKRALQEIHRG